VPTPQHALARLRVERAQDARVVAGPGSTAPLGSQLPLAT
jgi:hypothetical protein